MIYRTVLAALMVVCATAFIHNSIIKTGKSSSSLYMAKKLSFREESRKSLVEGINVVANAVKVISIIFDTLVNESASLITIIQFIVSIHIDYTRS